MTRINADKSRINADRPNQRKIEEE